eukprot:m.178890 g.178890  ORF g.178890 m.178890 type:complete len:566 (-) comp31953_c2_seq28:129-1826(-)
MAFPRYVMMVLGVVALENLQVTSSAIPKTASTNFEGIHRFEWRQTKSGFVEISAHFHSPELVRMIPSGTRRLRNGHVAWWKLELPEPPHPDQVAVACLMTFLPFVGTTIQFPFPISQRLQSLIESGRTGKWLRGVAQLPKGPTGRNFIRVVNHDIKPGWVRPQPLDVDNMLGTPGNTKQVVAFGGGMDSSALAVLLPGCPLFHEMNTCSDRSSAAIKACTDPLYVPGGKNYQRWQQAGYTIHHAFTNVRVRDGPKHLKNEPTGWWASVTVSSNLFAISQGLGATSYGSVLSSGLGNGGQGLGLVLDKTGSETQQEIASKKLVQRFLDPKSVCVLWQAAGLACNFPTAGLSEFLNAVVIAKFALRTKNMDFVNAPEWRGITEMRKDTHNSAAWTDKCFKCPRKELSLLAALLYSDRTLGVTEAVSLLEGHPKTPFWERNRRMFVGAGAMNVKRSYRTHFTRAAASFALLDALEYRGLKSHALLPPRSILEGMAFPESAASTWATHYIPLELQRVYPSSFSEYFRARLQACGIEVGGTSTDMDLLTFNYSKAFKEHELVLQRRARPI